MAMRIAVLYLTAYIFFSCLSSSSGASCGAQARRGFDQCALLSPAVALHWRDEGSAITIALEVDGSWDWVGFGLSEAGGMNGADITIARRNLTSDAGWWVGDYWAMGFRTPTLDRSQDAVLLSAGWTSATLTSGATTTIVFRRPLDTCDEQEDMRILRGTMQYYIYAYGNKWGYHGLENRGNAQLVLLPLRQANAAPGSAAPAAAVPAPQPSSDSSSSSSSHVWELQLENVTIPAVDTSYLCRDFEVPNPETKVHISEWQVVVDNPRQVHHMVVYACSERPATPRQLYSCMAMDPACVTFYAVWAPGSDHFHVPAEAGIALGGDSGVNWVALQIHYSNPELREGLVDSSGFRMTVSTTLRPYDMGILALGSLDIAIPPGMSNFTSRPNLCPGACTRRLGRPVTLVQAGFHMHTLGRSIRTQWYRNGQELPRLATRRAYDFNFQGAAHIDPSHNVLLPGDELVTTCSWNSSSRNTTTWFGESTRDEMCFNFVAYYPRSPGIDICSSATTPLLGGGSVAFCTTLARVRRLSAASRSGNMSALLQTYVSMTSTGDLVSSTLPEYTPYQPTCVPVNISSGGSNSSGGDGGSDGYELMPPPPEPMTSSPPPPDPTGSSPPSPQPTASSPPPPELAASSPPPPANATTSSPPPPRSSATESPPPKARKSPPPPQKATKSPPPQKQPPPPRKRPPPPQKATKSPPPRSLKSPPPLKAGSRPPPPQKAAKPPPPRAVKTPPPSKVKSPPPTTARRPPPPRRRSPSTSRHHRHPKD